MSTAEKGGAYFREDTVQVDDPLFKSLLKEAPCLLISLFLYILSG